MAELLTRRLTAEEFFDTADANERTELVHGEVRRMYPGGGEHGVVAMNAGTVLAAYVKAHGLGVVCAAETGFIVARDPDTVRAPDAAFVSKERLGDQPIPRKYWPFAPDLALEVVSPNDSADSVEAKVHDWLAAGTRLVLVLYPATRTGHVYRSLSDVRMLGPGDTFDAGDVVPGFMCPVNDLFP
jgi:Uma2 family endonuclease